LNISVASAIGAALLVLAAPGARAQVIDIDDGGVIHTYSGPVRTLDSSTQPLAPRAGDVSRSKDSVNRLLALSAERHQLSPRLVEAVAWRESRLDQAAVSAKGARGVMQLMPATAAALGVDANDLAGNIEGGTSYLALLMERFDGDLVRSLAAYNAGAEAVRRFGGLPPYPETRAYVAAVLNRLASASDGMTQ
jgi:soluble lytic murein transglycosylase-like protein